MTQRAAREVLENVQALHAQTTTSGWPRGLAFSASHMTQRAAWELLENVQALHAQATPSGWSRWLAATAATKELLSSTEGGHSSLAAAAEAESPSPERVRTSSNSASCRSLEPSSSRKPTGCRCVSQISQRLEAASFSNVHAPQCLGSCSAKGLLSLS
jgi:hypothetical protein